MRDRPDPLPRAANPSPDTERSGSHGAGHVGCPAGLTPPALPRPSPAARPRRGAAAETSRARTAQRRGPAQERGADGAGRHAHASPFVRRPGRSAGGPWPAWLVLQERGSGVSAGGRERGRERGRRGRSDQAPTCPRRRLRGKAERGFLASDQGRGAAKHNATLPAARQRARQRVRPPPTRLARFAAARISLRGSAPGSGCGDMSGEMERQSVQPARGFCHC